jgi:hypothetical protein
MGLFDKFKSMKENNQKKSAEKSGDVLKNKVTTKDQRMEAISHLLSLPAQIAAPQLLKRFEMTVDHGIQDNREKEACLEFLVENPDHSKELIVTALKNRKKVAWPLKVAEKLFSTEEFTALVRESLSMETALFDDDEIEKNIDLLLALKEYPTEAAILQIEKFLTARDEPLKIATIECLEAHAHKFPAAKALLEEYSTKLQSTAALDGNSRLAGLVLGIVTKLGTSP